MNKLVKKSFVVFVLSLLSSNIHLCKANSGSQVIEISNNKVSEIKLNNDMKQDTESLDAKSNNNSSEQVNLERTSDLKQNTKSSQDFDLNNSNYITSSGELVTFDKKLVSEELAKDYIGTGRIYIWDYLRDKYLDDESVSELVFVKYKNSSYADIELYIKNKDGWECALKCDGYVGPKGIGTASIDYARTPEGDFKISVAFGIKSKPEGVNLKYLQVKEGMYCCGDQYCPYFNKIIDANALNHKCLDGEHLIDYPGVYNYGFWFDHNKECDYEKGAAFFFHCKGKYDYTGGCVAVTEENMIKILKKLHPNARLCMYCKEQKVKQSS